jgi:hypothetical protein
MLAAIKLDNQLRVKAYEIDDVWPKRLLTLELETLQSMATHLAPKQSLCIRRTNSEHSR